MCIVYMATHRIPFHKTIKTQPHPFRQLRLIIQTTGQNKQAKKKIIDVYKLLYEQMQKKCQAKV